MEGKATLRDLFEEALVLPPSARARLLAERCSDPAVRAELERMLEADATDDELLAAGGAAGAARTIGEVDAIEPLPAGSRIGPFELLKVLGEGGSSTVFRAFREVDGVRQYVAVKLLARGLYTAEAKRRFHHEREALARLRHPAIARLIQGGATDNGLAYIALELIDGVPITRHVHEHGLPERQRLTLFLRVCRAVESAHRALIVHRDIKPTNVLVTAEGDVKLLDFGIAKLLDDTEDATRTRHQALTPAYAAPEQFTPDAITTATDVYALGVLLRELLTGERNAPNDAHSPSLRASDSDNSSVRAKPVARKLQGDLGNIIAMATAQEPERRYGSAGALAEDIERYLDLLPVQAHPPTRWYRARRFVARHRGGVAVTGTLLLAICVSLSIALWQAHVARREAQRANAIRDFVVGVLRKTAPDVAADKRPDVPTLVYTAAADLPRDLREQPETRAELLYTLGNVLRDMRDIPHSDALLRKAEKNAQALPITSPVRIGTEVGLIRTLIREGDYDGATNRMAPLLTIPAHRLPEDAPRAMLLKIAMVIADGRGDMTTAVARGREMLGEYRADCAKGLRCDELAFATHDLASVLLDADRIAEARILADEALARKRHGATPFSLADTMELQSKIALYRGDLAAANADARNADTLLNSLGNSLHSKPLEAQSQRIDTLLAMEKAAAAEALADTLMAEQRARKTSSCNVAWTEMQQARAGLLLQRVQNAAADAAHAVNDGTDCRRDIVRDVTVALARLVHGRALAAAGNLVGAQAEYAKVSGWSARVHVDDPLSWPLFLAESMRLAVTLGHDNDAVRDADRLIAALDRAGALPSHPWRLEAQLTLARASPGSSAATAIDTPAFDAALARIHAWPVAARLTRLRSRSLAPR